MAYFCHFMIFFIMMCMTNAAYRGGNCPSACRCLFFEGLQSVYCNRTGITSVPSGIPSGTQLLELSENAIGQIAMGDLQGLNSLQELYLSANGLSEDSISTGALDLPKLVTIDLLSNLYKTIPKCLPKAIRKLWFLNNRVKTLKSDSFVNYTDLQYLDFSNNHMYMVEEGAFDPLFFLQTLYFSFNYLTDGSIPPGAFKRSTNLQILSVRDNSLQHMFKNLPPSLKHLDYVGNQIKTIPAYSFVDIPRLETLAFWEGQGEGYAFRVHFQGLRLVLTLLQISRNVDANRVTPICYTSCIPAPEPLHMFGTCSPILEGVKESNEWEKTFQVATIEDNAFYGLTNLTILDINMNKLSVITNNTFTGLTGLHTCYMYTNNIKNVDVAALRNFKSLSELWLQGNELSKLQPEVLDVKYIPKLSKLYIDSNPWYCDCHLRWLREKVDNASYAIQDPHLITCAGPAKLAGKAWDILKPGDFVCP